MFAQLESIATLFTNTKTFLLEKIISVVLQLSSIKDEMKLFFLVITAFAMFVAVSGAKTKPTPLPSCPKCPETTPFACDCVKGWKVDTCSTPTRPCFAPSLCCLGKDVGVYE